MNENFFQSIQELKKLKKKIILCHGVFDVLHSGHIRYFEQAKKFGDILVVSVTSDKYVDKGNGRPIFNLRNRTKILNELKIVDFVITSNYQTAVNVIKNIKPDFYCKGPDYAKSKNDRRLNDEIIAVKNFKGKFVTVKHNKKSSTEIIKKKKIDLLDKFKIDDDYVNIIKKKYGLNFVIQKLSKLKELKVFVTGDLIIDRYIFVDVVGKSGKDSFLVLKKKNDIKFLGGSAYIANICAEFVDKLTYTSFVGEKKSQINFIQKNLNNKINYKLLKKEKSNTFVKLRYVDYYKNNKIIGAYDVNDDPICDNIEKKYILNIRNNLKKNDVVILADYGHGIITNLINKELQKHHQKLYLNIQVNAFNKGLNTILKYKKINSIIINENEIRNELRDNNSPIDNLAKELRKKINYKNLFITRGKHGVNLFRDNKKFYCPSFANNRFDTVGAGDTFLAMAGLMDKTNCPPDVTLFISSIYSAFCVSNVGNKQILNLEKFKKIVTHFFDHNHWT